MLMNVFIRLLTFYEKEKTIKQYKKKRRLQHFVLYCQRVGSADSEGSEAVVGVSGAEV